MLAHEKKVFEAKNSFNLLLFINKNTFIFYEFNFIEKLRLHSRTTSPAPIIESGEGGNCTAKGTHSPGSAEAEFCPLKS